MSTPKFGQVIDALNTIAQTTSTQKVYDGPVVTDEYPEDFVVVGGTENPEDDEPSSFTQEWHGLGARTKIETGEVTCAVLVGTGNTNGVKASRDRALVILSEVEAGVREDPTLDGVLVDGWCHLSAGRHTQRLNTQGLYVRILFTIGYQTKN